MATATQARVSYAAELAEFIASGPSAEQILAHHPSVKLQERISELLDKKRENLLTPEEQEQLNEVQTMELLMRLVKAKARARQQDKSA